MENNMLKAANILWAITSPFPITAALILLREHFGTVPLFSTTTLMIVAACILASVGWSLFIKMLQVLLDKRSRQTA
jgi:ABC-type Na+ efflux pump permease subunit|nr:hypothetical protein [Neorhizobium tomejilense]